MDTADKDTADKDTADKIHERIKDRGSDMTT